MSPRFSLILVLAGCAAELSSPGPQPPPVAGFGLEAPDLVFRGEPAQVTATLPSPPAPANGVNIWLAWTDGGLGAGACPPALGGECLDIAGTPTPLGPVPTVSGSSVLRHEVDVTHPGGVVGYQGVVLAAGTAFLSAPIEVAVEDPPELFAVDGTTDELFTIDPLTGVGTLVGHTGVAGPVGLASCGTRLFLVERQGGIAASSNIYEVDQGSGLARVRGQIGFGDMRALTCLGPRGPLYGLTGAGDLIEIDTVVFQGTIVGNPGVVDAESLAWLPSAGALYAVDGQDQLHRIQVGLAPAGPLASVGTPGITGLTAHEQSGVLYAASATTGELVLLDPVSGDTTVRAILPSADVQGLAF